MKKVKESFESHLLETTTAIANYWSSLPDEEALIQILDLFDACIDSDPSYDKDPKMLSLRGEFANSLKGALANDKHNTCSAAIKGILQIFEDSDTIEEYYKNVVYQGESRHQSALTESIIYKITARYPSAEYFDQLSENLYKDLPSVIDFHKRNFIRKGQSSYEDLGKAEQEAIADWKEFNKQKRLAKAKAAFESNEAADLQEKKKSKSKKNSKVRVKKTTRNKTFNKPTADKRVARTKNTSTDKVTVKGLAKDFFESKELTSLNEGAEQNAMRLLLRDFDYPKAEVKTANYIEDPSVNSTWLVVSTTGKWACLVYLNEEDAEDLDYDEVIAKYGRKFNLE